jgi:hypothetical protein
MKKEDSACHPLASLKDLTLPAALYRVTAAAPQGEEQHVRSFFLFFLLEEV